MSWDWQGVDTPSKLAELTKKGKVEMTIKDGSKKGKEKVHRFKVQKKTAETKKEEKPKELAKAEANNPIKEEVDLMTSADTSASRDVMAWVEDMKQQLERVGFTVEPIGGFSVEDLKY